MFAYRIINAKSRKPNKIVYKYQIYFDLNIVCVASLASLEGNFDCVNAIISKTSDIKICPDCREGEAHINSIFTSSTSIIFLYYIIPARILIGCGVSLRLILAKSSPIISFDISASSNTFSGSLRGRGGEGRNYI